MKQENKNAFGMIGLGTMGSNLLQNIADHGYDCAGYDNSTEKVNTLNALNNENIQGFSNLKEFTDSLKSPKVVMMLVPAGEIVDNVIDELLAVLDKGDIIIDGGNSHYTDTERRYKELESKGFHFVGMGVSGGEEGARKGPSMMPGGDEEAYEIIKPILEKIAAQVNGEPTVAFMGNGSAGHFVKMVHNGIEYGLMQLIAETYEILKKGLKLDNAAIQQVFEKWNEGRLKSFLLEITKDIFKYNAPGTDHLLIDDIKDEARAKGTGKWTSQVAMDLQAPIPTVDTAVSMRDLSKYKKLREDAAKLYSTEAPELSVEDKEQFIAELEQAFYFTMIISYAQGMHLLTNASAEYKYDLKLAEIAKIWRAGCIIRSQFLYDIYNAYTKDSGLAHLLLDGGVQNLVAEAVPGIRSVLSKTIAAGVDAPAYAASLSYFDAFRSARMPSNLTQAQRDYFGAHTYELIGKEGVFHTQWVPKSNN